jgi:hypothetical protein
MNDGTISRGGGRTRKLVRRTYKNRDRLGKRRSARRGKRMTYKNMRGGNVFITDDDVLSMKKGVGGGCGHHHARRRGQEGRRRARRHGQARA